MIIQGIDVTQCPESMIDRYKGGRLLVLGGGRSVWRDIDAVGQIEDVWDVMCVNDIMAYYQGVVLHGVTLHVEYMPGWMTFRRGHAFGYGRHVFTHSDRQAGGFPECTWKLDNLGGTSSMYGIFIGLVMGYEKILLAGIPMDGSGHFFDPPGDKTAGMFDNSSQKNVWWWARDNIFKGRVKSMSGNTREWLGGP